MAAPMMTGVGRAAAVLAAAATLLWALTQREDTLAPPPAPPPTPIVEPAAPAVAAVKPKRTPRKNAPAPAKIRGAALQEKGEALGGTIAE